MQLRYFLAASAAALSIASVVAVPASAQQITSGIEGKVNDSNGAPVTGATVEVTDTRTGNTRTLTTDSNGFFRADTLSTGGPYSVTATADGFEGQTVENININLQGNSQLKFALASGADSETIVVSGARAQLTRLAIGPGTSFGADELENLPSITRDIRDIIRIDPRVSLDRDNEVDRISCLGGNDRSNAFSVDGIIQSDVFGLNGTPFASRNSLPLPFDSIAETSVEFAPFDVQYGAFTGCAINVVTKAGQNDFHGTAFFNFASDGLKGDSIDGDKIPQAPFKEYRWGATLSGPIIKDRLFFSLGYEEIDTSDSQDDGPAGAGFANDLKFVTEAQFNEFSDVLKNVYGFETGGLARTLPETNRRLFGRIDAYINEDHRVELTYQRLDELNVEPDDFSGTNFTGLNTFEQEGTKSNYYSGRVYSQWSDDFSTQIRVSRAEVRDVQGPVGGGEAQSDNPIPRFIVGTSNVVDGGTSIGTLQAGPGFFRAANDLSTTITQVRAQASLKRNSHDFLFGVDFNELDVFNLFAPNSTGTLVFANIDDFRNGVLSGGANNTNPNAEDVFFGRASGAFGNFTASGDINDAAAAWKRRTFSVLAQDKWQASDNLSVLVGARLEWYQGDAPLANPNFLARYGFSNRISFSKLDPVILPRLGFTYDVGNDGFLSSTQIKGGVGVFTGGDPAVFFSNAFSNNGFLTGAGRTGASTCFPATGPRADVVVNGQFTGIPDCVITDGAAASARGLANTQSTDPNFVVPTVIRANIGFGTRFGTGDGGFFDDWKLNFDYIYSRFENPVDFVDLAQAVDVRQGLNGFTVDGRPIYRAIDPTAAGCLAKLVGTGGRGVTYSNLSAACFNTTRVDEIQLTNGASFDSHVASIALSKRFNRGLFTDGGSVNFNLGYAFTNAENNRFNFAATSNSNFDNSAAFDRQNSAIAPSEFSNKHNLTFSMNFKEQFFGNYDTQFGFVFVARSGRPYSATWNNGGVFNDRASGNDNALLYVPTGANDPNLAPTSNPIGLKTLEDFVAANPCVAKFRGKTLPRNSCTNDSFYDLDLRFSQELPGPGNLFGVEDSIKLFVDFDNFLNLVSDSANISRRFGTEVSPINLTGIDSAGRYIVGNVAEIPLNSIQTSSSLWRIQLGVSYKF